MMQRPPDSDRLAELVTAQRSAFGAGDYATATTLAEEAAALALETSVLRNRREGSPELSIIVVSFDCTAETLAMIDFLGRLTLDFRHEVIVVVNGDRRLRDHPMPDTLAVVDLAANMGASGGRNLGAHFASGRYLLFLDDDGATDAASIGTLYRTALDHDATAVRGRVQPRAGRAAGALYNPGDSLEPSIMDIEGITIWQAARFRQAGGYDPLLYGHEGTELYWRLYPQHGAQSFLYEPRAVLIHDPRRPSTPIPKGQSRYLTNLPYLKWKGTPYGPILRMMERAKATPEQRIALRACIDEARALQAAALPRRPLVSILTTVREAAPFVAEFSESLQRQTYQEFELIVVDDGASEATLQELSRHWQGDARLRLVPFAGAGEASGRGAALNTALASARGEVCLLADIRDVMVRKRIEWSVWRILEGRDCVACQSFDERQAIHDPLPLPLMPASVRLRRFVGTPVNVATLAFRKARFVQPFAEEAGAAPEVDWLFRNLAADPTLDGEVLPFLGCYALSAHDEGAKRDRREATRRCVTALHRALIAFDEEADPARLAMLLGHRPAEDAASIRAVYDYCFRFEGFDGAAEVRTMLLTMTRELQFRQLARAETRKNSGRKADAGQATEGSETPGEPQSPQAAVLSAAAMAEVEQAEQAWLRQYRRSRSLLGRLAARRPPPPPAHFDEEAYLAQNPDVALGLANGQFPSGFAHFMLHGRAEGRARALRGR